MIGLPAAEFRHRLPAISNNRQFALGHGLMSYGPSVIEMSRRAATFADKMLKGAKPGDLVKRDLVKRDVVAFLAFPEGFPCGRLWWGVVLTQRRGPGLGAPKQWHGRHAQGGGHARGAQAETCHCYCAYRLRAAAAAATRPTIRWGDSGSSVTVMPRGPGRRPRRWPGWPWRRSYPAAGRLLAGEGMRSVDLGVAL